MGWRRYSPLWTEIDAKGRKYPIKFGAEHIEMNIYAGPNIRNSELFVKVEVVPTEYGGAKLYVNGKLIKEV